MIMAIFTMHSDLPLLYPKPQYNILLKNEIGIPTTIVSGMDVHLYLQGFGNDGRNRSQN
jgi:hypothetical protein